MTTKDLLMESVGWAVEHQPLITLRFYEILFERYPQTRPLFSRNSREKQAEMLQGAVLAVLEHFEDAPWLEQTLRGVGAQHVQYGVTDEMYPWVGECLVAALADQSGGRWTQAHQDAWVAVWGALQGMALQGAAAARAQG